VEKRKKERQGVKSKHVCPINIDLKIIMISKHFIDCRKFDHYIAMVALLETSKTFQLVFQKLTCNKSLEPRCFYKNKTDHLVIL
jgi:hypothetical protein